MPGTPGAGGMRLATRLHMSAVVMSRCVRRSTATAANLKAPAAAPARCGVVVGKAEPPASCGGQAWDGPLAEDRATQGVGRQRRQDSIATSKGQACHSSEPSTPSQFQVPTLGAQSNFRLEQPHLLAQLCSPWTGPARGPGAQGSWWAGWGPRAAASGAGTLTTLDTETPGPQRASCRSVGCIDSETGRGSPRDWRGGRRAAGAEGRQGGWGHCAGPARRRAQM